MRPLFGCSSCARRWPPRRAAAQEPVAPQGPLTLLEAITLGRKQGVEAAIARLERAGGRCARRRSAGPTCCPPSAARVASRGRRSTSTSSGSRSPPGSPIRSTSARLQLRASQTIFDAGADRPAARRTGHRGRGGARRPGGRRDRGRHGRPRVPPAAERRARRWAPARPTAPSRPSCWIRRGSWSDAGVSPAIDATRSEVSFAAVRTQLEVARNAAGPRPARPAPIARPALGHPARAGGLAGLGPLDIPLDPDCGRGASRGSTAPSSPPSGPGPGGAPRAQARSVPNTCRASG